MSSSCTTPLLDSPEGRLANPVPVTDGNLAMAPPAGVTLRIDGILDGRHRHRVRPVVERWCKVPPLVPCSVQALLDLTDVTQLDATGLDLLNEAYLRLSGTGWKFRVTASAAIEARLVLNEAAIRGDLLWG